MIHTQELKTLEDFEALQKGDVIACEFHRDMHDYPKKSFRFKVFEIYKVLPRTTEIVLQKKNNIYFNYDMFLYPEKHGQSNLKSAVLLTTK